MFSAWFSPVIMSQMTYTKVMEYADRVLREKLLFQKEIFNL